MNIRTLSFVACAILLIGCNDTPTAPTNDSITIDSIVPAAGTALVAGERVTFTAVVTATIATANGGLAALVIQDQRNQLLRDSDTVAPEADLEKGTAKITLSQTITVPSSGSSVIVLVPIFIDGSGTTRAVATRTYQVR